MQTEPLALRLDIGLAGGEAAETGQPSQGACPDHVIRYEPGRAFETADSAQPWLSVAHMCIQVPLTRCDAVIFR